jgi:hypothetical protein
MILQAPVMSPKEMFIAEHEMLYSHIVLWPRFANAANKQVAENNHSDKDDRTVKSALF